MNGCFHINDNGYHKWGTSMEPSHHFTGSEEEQRNEQVWSTMLESLRKDVECFFGILKSMFAILKYGSRFKDWEIIDDIFLTCCALYNQRLVQKGGDQPWDKLAEDYENEVDVYDRQRGDENDADVFKRMREFDNCKRPPESNVGFHVDLEEQEFDIDKYTAVHVDDSIQLTHDQRKKMLINHFAYMRNNGLLRWPRRNGLSLRYLK
jgi:hypothetical protein